MGKTRDMLSQKLIEFMKMKLGSFHFLQARLLSIMRHCAVFGVSWKTCSGHIFILTCDIQAKVLAAATAIKGPFTKGRLMIIKITQGLRVEVETQTVNWWINKLGEIFSFRWFDSVAPYMFTEEE